MKKHLLLSLATMLALTSIAQIPEDALRYSGTNPFGTARSMAIGGAMGSLGGDIQAAFVNPAGLGMYKTNEFVMSPGFHFKSNKGDFRGMSASDDFSNFNLGTTGFVFGYNDRFSNWTSKAFSIAINRTANFSNKTQYRGLNDFSSFAEQYAEEFANSGYSINDDPAFAPVSTGTKLAANNLLIDVANINGVDQVVALPMYDALVNGGEFLVGQQKDVTTKGGITEIALGFAGNKNNRFYLGGSIGIPIINYERKTTFLETDETGNSDNNFNYARYYEETSTKGVGVNAKLGLIFKPASQVRAGLAIHTPTYFGITEKNYSRLTVDLESYIAERVFDADTYTLYGNSGVPDLKYTVSSPWKFIASGAYVISEVADTRLQKGFITADIEYVTYGAHRFHPSNSYYDQDEEAYYKDLNAVVKDYYKGAFNFRVGGEMKFNTFMARAGFAQYGNPYAEEALKNSRTVVSGGLGYRDKGIFVDLTYSHSINKDVDFPYLLGDKANTFANIKGNYGALMLSFGMKF